MKITKQTILFSILILQFAMANVINVPGDYSTIQAGIDAASNSDTVLVQPGTYTENIDYNGKNIVVGSLYLTTQDTSYISSTIIDGNQTGSVVTFESGEDSTSVFQGFTVTNGSSSRGGGIYCSSNPTLSNLIIQGNSATSTYYYEGGAGIYCLSSSPTIINVSIIGNLAIGSWGRGGGIYFYSNSNPILTNVIISGNSANGDGGAIICMYSSAPALKNVEISDNTAAGHGGAIYSSLSDLIISSSTISNNSAGQLGGGVYSDDAANPQLINSILWNNFPQEVWLNAGGSLTAMYSDIEGGWAGTGNINADPLFVDPANGDYHLSWTNYPVQDSTMSPCIDAGDPNSPFDPDSTIADMGAYYFDQSVLPDYSVILTPYNPPIEIPAGGGTFDYNVLIANNTDITQTFYAVLFADMPNGNQYGPIDPTPYLVQLQAGDTVDVDLTQNVPGNAPAGGYTYYCLVGTDYNTIVDSSGFTFTKLGTAQAEGTGDWISYYSAIGVEMRENDLWTVDGIYREDGTLIYGSMAKDERSLPVSFALYQNYPNPFNPVTTIKYELPEQSYVTIVIYDILGREVKELVSGELVSGYHKAVWDATDSFGKPVGAGVYLYQIQARQKDGGQAGEFIQTRKMVLLK